MIRYSDIGDPVYMLHLRRMQLRDAQQVLWNCRTRKGWAGFHPPEQQAAEVKWAETRVCNELTELWKAQEAVREWLR